ncbi:aegerolysin family protein [Nocardiopsis exhalans]|uniref:Aegerolysin family protein n=1 Tax=Nocardiopsis exhalans TaxID=163604 RepID=A0ABY5D7U5_9ACTN|nr:aegerolysin family protein [Nocardiopsis exhalans]USY19374.1 aegerolysin family protein [Nocardiopsis exhalans]
MADSLQMICHINNRTKQTLKVQSESLDHGKWYDPPNHYPVDVPSKETVLAFRSSGKSDTATGTQGQVVYQIGDDAEATVTISWDVPWLAGSSNTVTTKTSHQDIAASVDGFAGHGRVEDVTVKVVDGR